MITTEGTHEVRLRLIDSVLEKSDEIAHEHQMAMAIAQVSDAHDLYHRVIVLNEQFTLYIGMIRVCRPRLTTDLDVESDGWKSVAELVKRLLSLKTESYRIAQEAADILAHMGDD